jgi:hypothetical protein
MIGDEISLTEDLYHQLLGRYITTIEVLVKRIAVKDQKIVELERELENYGAKENRKNKNVTE